MLDSVRQLPALVLTPPRELLPDRSDRPTPLQVNLLENEQFPHFLFPLNLPFISNKVRSLLAPCLSPSSSLELLLVRCGAHDSVDSRIPSCVDPDNPSERGGRDEADELVPFLCEIIRVRRESRIERFESILGDDNFLLSHFSHSDRSPPSAQ